MAHLSEGALRRLYDEPHALVERDRAHYNSCSECQDRFSAVAEDARQALALMSVPAATVDADAALGRLKAREPAGATRRNPVLARLASLGSAPSLGGWGWRKPVAAGVVAVGLAASITFTPLAATIEHIFAPTQLTPTTVSVTQSDVQGLRTFSRWGDAKTVQSPELQQADSARQAARASGLAEIHVAAAALPGNLASAPVSYGTVSQGSEAVTFNGRAPKNLQGTTLTMQYGPGEVAVYGNLSKAISSASQGGAGDKTGTPPEAGAGSQSQESGAASQQGLQQALSSIGPVVGVAEMQVPKVTSNGASLQEIKDTLLAQPGLSDSVKNLIRQFNQPTGNLPIPIPTDMATAQPVSVTQHDVTSNATAIGDNTGLGAGVIWIKGGVVYVVAGTISVTQAVAIADTL
jgi:hypothetical protein